MGHQDIPPPPPVSKKRVVRRGQEGYQRSLGPRTYERQPMVEGPMEAPEGYQPPPQQWAQDLPPRPEGTGRFTPRVPGVKEAVLGHPAVAGVIAAGTGGLTTAERLMTPESNVWSALSIPEIEEMAKKDSYLWDLYAGLRKYQGETEAAWGFLSPEQEKYAEWRNQADLSGMQDTLRSLGDRGAPFRVPETKAPPPWTGEPPKMPGSKMSDEELAEAFEAILQQPSAEARAKYVKGHPLLSRGAEGLASLPSFVLPAGKAAKVAQLLKVTRALRGPISFMAADVALQAGRMKTGTQEGFDPVSAGVTGLAGGVAQVAGGIAGKTAQALRASEKVVSRIAGGAELVGFYGAEQKLSGEWDHATWQEHLVSIGVMAGGGAAMHRLVPGRYAREKAKALTVLTERMAREAEPTLEQMRGQWKAGKGKEDVRFFEKGDVVSLEGVVGKVERQSGPAVEVRIGERVVIVPFDRLKESKAEAPKAGEVVVDRAVPLQLEAGKPRGQIEPGRRGLEAPKKKPPPPKVEMKKPVDRVEVKPTTTRGPAEPVVTKTPPKLEQRVKRVEPKVSIKEEGTASNPVLVARSLGKEVGRAFIEHDHITNITVPAGSRRQGIGTDLLRKAEAYGATTAQAATAAGEALLKSAGWVKGERPAKNEPHIWTRPAPTKQPPEVQRARKAIQKDHVQVTRDLRALQHRLTRAGKGTSKKVADAVTGLSGAASELRRASDAPDRATAEKHLKSALDGALKTLREARGKLVKRKGEAGHMYVPDPGVPFRAIKRVAEKIIRAVVRAIKELSSKSRMRQKAQIALASAKGFESAGPLNREEVHKALNKGEKHIKSVKIEGLDTMVFTMDDGTTFKVWHPDSTSIFQEQTKRLMERPFFRAEDSKDAYHLATDIWGDLMWRRTPKLAGMIASLPLRAVDHAAGRNPGKKGSWTHYVKTWMTGQLQMSQDPDVKEIQEAHRVRMMTLFDEVRSIQAEVRDLLKKYGEGAHLLSEAMWEAHQGLADLDVRSFGDTNVARAYELIKRTQTLLARAGELMVKYDIIPEKAVERERHPEDPSRTLYAPHEIAGREIGFARATMKYLGMERILDPASIRKVITSHARSRKYTAETDPGYVEYRRRGGYTDYESVVRGTLREMHAVEKLELFEAVANSPLFTKKGDALPESEEVRRKSLATQEGHFDRLFEIMRDRGIPLTLFGPESRTQKIARGTAAKEHDALLKDLIGEGLDPDLPWGMQPFTKPYGTKDGRRQSRLLKTFHKAEAALYRDTRMGGGRPLTELAKTRPAPKYQYKATDPLTQRLNARLRSLLDRIEHATRMELQWKEIPDAKEWGPMRGGYVRAAAWYEMLTTRQAMKSGPMMLYDTIHSFVKKNLVMRNFATSIKQAIGNEMLNGMAGQEVMSWAAAKYNLAATQAVWKFLKATHDGKAKRLSDYFPDDMKEYVREMEETGIFEAVAPIIETADLSRVAHRLDKVAESLKEGKPGAISDAFASKVVLLDAMIGSTKVFGTFERMHRLTDLAPMISLYISLRTGRGSKHPEPLSKARSFDPINLWYNYGRAPAAFSGPLKRVWSFGRFAWMASTGVPKLFFTAPVTLLPTKLIPGVKWAPTMKAGAYGKTRAAKEYNAISTGLAVGMARLIKFKAYQWMLFALYRYMLDEDEQTFEKARTSAAFGSPLDKWFQLPGFGRNEEGDPTFLNLMGLIPYTNVLEMTEDIGDQTLVARLAGHSIPGQLLSEYWTGKDAFGRDVSGGRERAWRTLRFALPGTLARVAEHTGKQAMDLTRRSWSQSVLDMAGIPIREGDPLSEPYYREKRGLKEGRFKKAEITMPGAPRGTLEYHRQKRELDKLKLMQAINTLRSGRSSLEAKRRAATRFAR